MCVPGFHLSDYGANQDLAAHMIVEVQFDLPNSFAIVDSKTTSVPSTVDPHALRIPAPASPTNGKRHLSISG